MSFSQDAPSNHGVYPNAFGRLVLITPLDS
jgi:hypothetical protein